MTETERLTKLVDDMTMAAARSAIALLHSFGLSGQEAEDLINNEQAQVKVGYPKRCAEYVGEVNIVKALVDAKVTTDEIQIDGTELAFAGRSVFTDAIFQFDRLVPLGQRIVSAKFGNRTYYGILALKTIDDCTYQCAIDYFEEQQ